MRRSKALTCGSTQIAYFRSLLVKYEHIGGFQILMGNTYTMQLLTPCGNMVEAAQPPSNSRAAIPAEMSSDITIRQFKNKILNHATSGRLWHNHFAVGNRSDDSIHGLSSANCENIALEVKSLR